MRLTLAELLILVIVASVVLAMIAGLLGPGRSPAEENLWRLRRVDRAIGRFRDESGRYPRSLAELHLGGPALDAWGRPFAYRVPGRFARRYELWSWGADGRPGGSGDDEDVHYRQTLPLPGR